MVNCNPETAIDGLRTSDRLYFEPLGVEEVLAICEREQPVGVVIQFGSQTRSSWRARSRKPASGSSGRRSTPSTSPRIASASARSAAGDRGAGVGDGQHAGGGDRRRGADRLPGSRPADHVLGRRQMVVCTTTPETVAASVRRRSWSSSSWRVRSSSTSTRSATAPTLRRRGDAARRGSRRRARNWPTATALAWTRAFARRSRRS